MAEDMTHIDEHNPDVHHEESDIDVRAVMVGTAITLAFFVATAIGIWAMFVGFRSIDRQLDPDQPTALEEPVAPSAEAMEFTSHWSEPARYLEKIQEEDRKVLEEYGWTDRERGLVRVPIEVGMEMALRKGYPTRTDGGAPVIGSGDATPHDPWVVHPTRAGEGTPRAEPETDATAGEEPHGGYNGAAAGDHAEDHGR